VAIREIRPAVRASRVENRPQNGVFAAGARSLNGATCGGQSGGCNMRVKASKDGVTLRAIAGTHAVLLGLDLAEARRAGCLGFSIERTDLDTGDRRWLPNMLRFKADPRPPSSGSTTATAPLQKFRWGDYTVEPGRRYRYRAIARFGAPAQVLADGVLAEKPGGFDAVPGGVTVELRTEDNRQAATAVFFNRGAAASKAYNDKFGDNDPDDIPAAKEWLSRGLQEGLLAFLARAQDGDWALHAVVYEFQKPELLAGLKAAADRGAAVEVVYHARRKKTEVDDDAKAVKAGKTPGSTKAKNEAAIAAAQFGFAPMPRTSNPNAIMHDKYVVLLHKGAAVAVWTGSTNWTDGGLYGQLNVGHAIDDAALAATYEKSFQLLKGDPAPDKTQAQNAKITPLPGTTREAIPHGITPLFSPQKGLDMLDLYADVCRTAKLLMVSAPFELHDKIKTALESPTGNDVLRYVLADKEGSLGGSDSVKIMERDPAFTAAVATALDTPLHDFQNRLLEGKQSFHHAGVHVHSKIIAADPLGPDPILIMGSANFSSNSTITNDSNVLIFRGDTAVTDIYVADFMRMFEHYLFRYHLSRSEEAAKGAPADANAPKKPSEAAAADPASVGMGLHDDDSWSAPYYVTGSREERDRLAFAGQA
jgi:phosphatidylserine/phosphatidylglycerophosphate/cardiolipin synthase-like enzyme